MPKGSESRNVISTMQARRRCAPLGDRAPCSGCLGEEPQHPLLHKMTLGDAQSEDKFRQMVEADGLQWNDYKLT